jgi:2-polyprenyl-6-methoxyphenol hydroxylase-like FAD-dependent oxidoreductase
MKRCILFLLLSRASTTSALSRTLHMSSTSKKSIAIVGGGPIGLEAALSALKANYEVTLFERGDTASNVKSWGHVRLFSPNSLNVSPNGLEALKVLGVSAPNPADFILGSELIHQYLTPIEGYLRKAGAKLHFNTEVLSIGYTYT